MVSNRTTDIDSLTELTITSGTDLIIIQDVSTGETKKITVANSGLGGTEAFGGLTGNSTTSASLSGTPAKLAIFDAIMEEQDVTADASSHDITVDIGGLYDVVFVAHCTTSTATTATLAVAVNGTTSSTYLTTLPTADGGGTDYRMVSLAGTLNLDAADVVSIYGNRGSGSPTLNCEFVCLRLKLLRAD